MSKEIDRNVQQLGIILQIFTGALVNLANHPDDSTLAVAKEKHMKLENVLDVLNISVKVPFPIARDAILSFFTSHLQELTMEIGKRLEVHYSTHVSNIFHFSTGMAGYLQTKKQATDSPKINILKASIQQQAKELGIKPSIVKDFIEKPNDIWDDLVKELLQGETDKKDVALLTVLFLAADPTDASRLRLGKEFREIDEQLKLARQRDYFKLALPQLSLRTRDITGALLEIQPQIVHFSGHGTPEGALCFENETGQTHLVQPEAMAALFEQFASQVKCVLLNACYSETQAKAIAKHIDYVIGMNEAIGDRAAIAFSIGFYQALGAGRPIAEAYELGRVQIMIESIPEHLIPVLIQKLITTPNNLTQTTVDQSNETIQQLRAQRNIEVIPNKNEDGTHSEVTLFLNNPNEIVLKSEAREILVEVRDEQDLSGVSHDPRFMEQRWCAGDRDVEWSVYKDKLFVRPKLTYEKIACQRINIIYGPFGIGKSIYLLSYLQDCLKNSFYEHILFLNRKKVDEALGEIEEKIKEYVYNPKKILLVIDGFSFKNYTLFDEVLSNKYAAVITLRDINFQQLKIDLGDKWENYSQISNEIPIKPIAEINDFYSDLLTNYSHFYGIKYEGNFNEVKNQIIQKSNGIIAYLVLLLNRTKKERNGVLDNESIKYFPTGFEKLVLDTIEKNFIFTDDKVIPTFLALLKYLHSKPFYLTVCGCRITYEFAVTYFKCSSIRPILDSKFKSLLDFLEKPPLMKNIFGRRLSNHWIEALEVLLKDHTETGTFLDTYHIVSNERELKIFIMELKKYLKNELTQRLSMSPISSKNICLISDLAVLGDIEAAKEFYLNLNLEDKCFQEGNLSLKTLTGLYTTIAYEAKSIKDFDSVIIYYKEINRLDPDNALTYFLLARSYEKKGDFENAENEFLKAIELNEKSEQRGTNVIETFKIRHAYTVFLRRRLRKTSQQERNLLINKIEDQYKFLLRVDQTPPDAFTMQNLALFYDEVGNYEKAQEIFCTSIKQFQTHVPSYHAYAKFCQKRGDMFRATNIEEANKYYQLADDYFTKSLDIAREQNFSLSSVLSAYAYFKQIQALYQYDKSEKLLKEAYQLYKEVLKIDPTNIQTLVKFPEFCGKVGAKIFPDYKLGLDEAKQFIVQALKQPLNPMETFILKNVLGILLYKYNAPPDYPNYSESKRLLTEASQSPDHLHNAMTYHELAKLYSKQNKRDEADEYFKKATEIKETPFSINHLKIACKNYASFLNAIGDKKSLDYENKYRIYAGKIGVGNTEDEDYLRSISFGNKEFNSKHYDTAISYYRLAVNDDKSEYFAWWKMAQCYKFLGNFEEAKNCYVKSARIQNSSQGYGMVLKDLKNLCKLEKFDLLSYWLEFSKKAIELSPENPKNYSDYGEGLKKEAYVLKVSKPEKAKKFFLDAIKQFQTAIQKSESLGYKEKEREFSYWNLGKCYQEIGNYREAINNFKKSAEIRNNLTGYKELMKNAQRMNYSKIELWAKKRIRSLQR